MAENDKPVQAVITPVVGPVKGVAEAEQKLKGLSAAAEKVESKFGTIGDSFVVDNVAKKADSLRRRFDSLYKAQEDYNKTITQFQRVMDAYDFQTQLTVLEGINSAFSKLSPTAKLAAADIAKLGQVASGELRQMETEALLTAKAMEKIAVSAEKVSERTQRAMSRAAMAAQFAPQAEANRFQQGVNLATTIDSFGNQRGLDPFGEQRRLNERKKFWAEFEAQERAAQQRMADLFARSAQINASRVSNIQSPGEDYAAMFARDIGPQLDSRRAAAQAYAVQLNATARATKELADRQAELDRLYRAGDLTYKELRSAMADVKKAQDDLNKKPPDLKHQELERLVSTYGRLQTEIKQLEAAYKTLADAQARGVIVANTAAGKEALAAIRERIDVLRGQASGATGQAAGTVEAQRLADQYDRAGAAARRLAADEIALNKAFAENRISAEQLKASLAGLATAKASLNAPTTAYIRNLDQMTEKGENLYQRNLILRSGFLNVFQSIAAGQSVFSTLFIQSTQVVGAFGNLNMAVLAVGAGVAVVLGSLAGMAAAIAKTGDAAVMAQGRLVSFLDDSERAIGIYARLQTLGEITGVQAADSAGVFSRLMIGGEQIGATTAQMERLLETFQKLGILGSATTQELVAGMRQFTQALGKGKLDGDEFRSILENLPEVVRLLGRNMGKSTEELREMGRLGQLTSRLVFDAMLKGSEEVDRRFQNLPLTMTRAFSQMQVALSGVWTELDRLTSLSTRLAEILVGVARKLTEFRQWLVSMRDPENTQNNLTRAEGVVGSLEELRKSTEERLRILREAQARERELLNRGRAPDGQRLDSLGQGAMRSSLASRAEELRRMEAEIARVDQQLVVARANQARAYEADLPRRNAELDQQTGEAEAADFSAQRRREAEQRRQALEELEKLRQSLGGAYIIEERALAAQNQLVAGRVALESERVRIEMEAARIGERTTENASRYDEVLARRVRNTSLLTQAAEMEAAIEARRVSELENFRRSETRETQRVARTELAATNRVNRLEAQASQATARAFQQEVRAARREEAQAALVALRATERQNRIEAAAARENGRDAQRELTGMRRDEARLARQRAQEEARAARARQRTGRRATAEDQRLDRALEGANDRGDRVGASREIQAWLAIEDAINNYNPAAREAADNIERITRARLIQLDLMDQLEDRLQVEVEQIERVTLEVQTQNRIRELETIGTRAARDEIDRLTTARAVEALEIQKTAAILRLENDLVEANGDARERVLSLINRTRAAYDGQIAAQRAPQNQRSYQESIAQQQRALDNAVKESGDFFYDYMTGKSNDIGEVFGNALKRGIADAMAEEFVRPLISPIVRGIVGPGSVTESFFPGGIGGSLGGLTNALGLGGEGGLFSGLQSFLSTPIFGESTRLAATNSAIAALPDGMMGPALPSALGAGGASLGSLIGAGAAGFGAGSLIGGLFAGDSPARKTNSMIGAGVGTAAGIALAPFTGGLSVLAAGLIGGVGGGALGGLLGPGKGFSGGDAIIGSDGSGGLAVTREAGKNFDTSELAQQVREQLKVVNAQLDALGIKFGNDLFAAVGGGESKNPRTIGGALDQFGVSGFSDNPLINTVIQGKSFDDAVAAATWVKEVYEPLVRASDVSKTFSNALDDLKKPFDEAISKAQEYGLSINEIESLRAKAIAKAERDNFREIQDLDINLWSRAAEGNDRRTLEERQNAFRISADRQRADLGDQLAARGVTGEWAATIRARLEKALETEAQGFIDAWKELARSWREQADGLSVRIMRGRAALSGSAVEARSADLRQFDSEAKSQIEELEANLKKMGRGASYVTEEVGRLTMALNLERAAIIKSYDDRKMEIRKALGDRLFATQNDTSTLDGALAAFNRQANEERLEAAKVGLTNMVLLEQVQAAERLKIIEDFGKQASEALMASGKSIRQFLNELQTGQTGGVSAQDRLAAARRQYGEDLALARGGNAEALGRITSTASSLIEAAKDNFASGKGFQDIFAYVQETLAKLPATRTYDQMILDELRKLGGAVNVAVDLEVVRVITEKIAALSETDKSKLIQTQTVLQTVEEKLGKLLTATELNDLVQGEIVRRDIEQRIEKNITEAERAQLLRSETVERMIEQSIKRDLSQNERDGIFLAGGVIRSVEQQLGKQLTAAEKAMLILPETVRRPIEQNISRPLTAEEMASIVTPGKVVRNIEQTVKTSESIEISRRMDDTLTAHLFVQAALLSEILKASLAVAFNTSNLLNRQGGSGITSYVNPNKTDLFWRFRANANVALDRIGNEPGDPFQGFTDLDAGSNQMFATGGAFSNGVVYRPTDFMLPDGSRGTMGEAGAEVILPLTAMPNGNLGVQAALSGGSGEELQAVKEELAQIKEVLRATQATTEDLARLVAESGNRNSQGQAAIVEVLSDSVAVQKLGVTKPK